MDENKLSWFEEISITLRVGFAYLIFDIISIPVKIACWLLDDPILSRGEFIHALHYECAVKKYGGKENLEFMLSSADAYLKEEDCNKGTDIPKEVKP